MHHKPFAAVALVVAYLWSGACTGEERGAFGRMSASSVLDNMTAVAKQIEGTINSLPEPTRDKANKLAAMQKDQIEAAEQQCGRKRLVTREELEACLAPSFKTGAELISILRALAPRAGQQKAYSPDPSYCASSCHDMCGYDSLGDKACWFSCYRYCMNAGTFWP